LPHGYVATREGPAHYGLIVCPPLGSCLIRTTAGRLVKLRLDRNGKFFKIPCDARDRALMDRL
jgi:hypothetical protein